MKETIAELKALFTDARAKSEFEFVLTLINYKGMASHKVNTNLHEWLDGLSFYKSQYQAFNGKEKTRIGALLYSTFFENNDFYNIIGSLCRISLGFKGSSYLFWKTRKYERLLGVGEKQDYLIELLVDAKRPSIVLFFENNHFKEIRNSFFHSAYALHDDEYVMQDTDPILINGKLQTTFSVTNFFYPIVENIIAFFDEFKRLYLESFSSFTENKSVKAMFPGPTTATILGNEKGLQGFKIENATQFFGQKVASGIWYNEQWDWWEGHNITSYTDSVETIEVRDQLTRYEGKDDITKSDAEFHNLVDKIVERNQSPEIMRIVPLLVKFGNVRYKKMEDEQNPFKKKSYPKIILPFYERAAEIGGNHFDINELRKRIKDLSEKA